MAGSYNHVINSKGKLMESGRGPGGLSQMLENGGDVYEAVEEMYGMIWFLAKGDRSVVENAHQKYREGLIMSPGLKDMTWRI